jgi:hypothetical protein
LIRGRNEGERRRDSRFSRMLRAWKFVSTPTLKERLAQRAAREGRNPDETVPDVVARYFEEEGRFIEAVQRGGAALQQGKFDSMNHRPGEIGLADLDSPPRSVLLSSSPARTLTRRDLSSCTCLSPPSEETGGMKYRYRGFRFWTVNL